MGQKLSATTVVPGQELLGLRMVLKCDGGSLICIESTYYGLDYQLMRKEAHGDGWRHRPANWLGPCCVGRLRPSLAPVELFD